MNAQDLKNSILQLAVQGKLVEQWAEEGTAKELLAQIKAEKEKLVKEKKIKKEKPLPKITEEEKPFEIPESWEWVRLGEIGDTNIGLTYQPSDKCENGTIVLRSSNILNGKMNYDDIVKVNCDIPNRAKINKGDLLICARNGSRSLVGKAAIVDRDNMSFGAFMAKFCSSINEFVYVFLQSPLFRSQLDGVKTETINQITQNMLRTQLMPLPPLAEQKRIVAKIEEILPYIEQYDKAYTKLETFNKKFPSDMKKSILQLAMQGKLVEQRAEEGTADELYQQIVDEKAKLIKEGKIKKEKPLAEITDEEIPFEIPKSWKWVRLGNIFASIADGDHQPPPQVSEGIPFLVISNISKEKIDLENVRHVPKDYFNALNNSRKACKGDILFTVTGSYGIVVPVDFNIQFCFQRHMALLKPLVIETEFYIEWLRSPFVYNQCTKLATGIAQKTVGINSLKNIIIPLPPLAEQKRIVAKLEQILPYCDQLMKS